MKCSKCKFYKSNFYVEEPWNACSLLSIENFKEQTDCGLINEDGSINQEEIYKSPL